MQTDSLKNIAPMSPETTVTPQDTPAVETGAFVSSEDTDADYDSEHTGPRPVRTVPVQRDTLLEIITVPQIEPGDTVIDTDLDRALAASAYVPHTDIAALHKTVPPPAPSWQDGFEGMPRAVGVGDDNGVLAVITAMFLVMLLSFRHCRRLFATLFHELLGMRQRANVFDDHTSNETQMMVMMAVQWSVYTGLLGYCALSAVYTLAPGAAFLHTAMLIGLTGAYYVFQLCAYYTLGFTFASRAGRRHFVQGFTASQSLLGFFLIIPALVAIFYPSANELMLEIAAVCYLVARGVFIVKGFRIFYTNFFSLFYFILYLCALEIIPLIILYRIALILVVGQ